MEWFLIIAALFAGVCIGILSAMFGIGGGVVMVPLLRLGFGLPAVNASATSLFAILPTSISGVINRFKDGTINFKIGLITGLIGMFISPLGALLATHLPGYVAMVVTAVIVIYMAIKYLKKFTDKNVEAHAKRKHLFSKFDPKESYTGHRLVLFSALAGAIGGMASGFLGLGGGFIIVPLFGFIFGMTMKQASGTSLVAISILGVPGFLTHAFLGNVVWLYGIAFILGSIPGTYIGSKVVKKITNRWLSLLFAILLLCSGILLAVNELLGM